MTTRAERLRAYVDDAAGAPVIGRDDCGPWVSGWIERERGCELGLPAYTTREEGRALIAAAGGLVRLVEPALAAAGLFETGEPKLGDVGIIKFAGEETAVIFATHGLALLRCEKAGVLALRPRHIIHAWEIEDGDAC